MRPREVDDAAYFRERAIEEQVAARRATCAAARQRHDEMAALYRFKAMLANGGGSVLTNEDIPKLLIAHDTRIRESAL